jgi:hypothetical protein
MKNKTRSITCILGSNIVNAAHTQSGNCVFFFFNPIQAFSTIATECRCIQKVKLIAVFLSNLSNTNSGPEIDRRWADGRRVSERLRT